VQFGPADSKLWPHAYIQNRPEIQRVLQSGLRWLGMGRITAAAFRGFRAAAISSSWRKKKLTGGVSNATRNWPIS